MNYPFQLYRNRTHIFIIKFLILSKVVYTNINKLKIKIHKIKIILTKPVEADKKKRQDLIDKLKKMVGIP